MGLLILYTKQIAGDNFFLLSAYLLRPISPAQISRPLQLRFPSLFSSESTPPLRIQLLGSESSSSAQNPAPQLRIHFLSSKSTSSAQNPAPQLRIQLFSSESSFPSSTYPMEKPDTAQAKKSETFQAQNRASKPLIWRLEIDFFGSERSWSISCLFSLPAYPPVCLPVRPPACLPACRPPACLQQESSSLFKAFQGKEGARWRNHAAHFDKPDAVSTRRKSMIRKP